MTIVYAVCCSSRSGSSLLSDLLSNTEVLGKPAEYMNKGVGTGAPRWKKELGLDEDISLEKYLPHLIAKRSTPNGLFGIKLLPSLYMEMQPVVQPSHHIFIRRRDCLRQAISLYRSQKSGQWGRFSADDKAKPVEFDAKEIFNRVKTIHSVNRRWAEVLGNWGIEPYKIWCEDLVADKLGEIRKIATYLGVDPQLIEKVKTRHIQQADAVSEDWYSQLKDVEAVQMSRLMN